MTPLINLTDGILSLAIVAWLAAPSVEHLRKLVIISFLQQSREELDLLNGAAVEDWFSQNLSVVVLAAAKVGGIQANNAVIQLISCLTI